MSLPVRNSIVTVKLRYPNTETGEETIALCPGRVESVEETEIEGRRMTLVHVTDLLNYVKDDGFFPLEDVMVGFWGVFSVN